MNKELICSDIAVIDATYIEHTSCRPCTGHPDFLPAISKKDAENLWQHAANEVGLERNIPLDKFDVSIAKYKASLPTDTPLTCVECGLELSTDLRQKAKELGAFWA